MNSEKELLNNKLFFLGLDFLILLALFYTFLWIHIPTVPKNLDGFWIFTYSQFKSLGLIILSWLLISQQTKLYGFVQHFTERVRKIIFQIFLFALVIFAISGVKTDYLYTNQESAIFISILTVYLFISRGVFRLILKYAKNSGKTKRSKVIIVGKNNHSDSFIKMLKTKENEYELLNVYTKKPKGKEEFLSINDFEKSIQTTKPDCIFISMFNEIDKNLIAEVVSLANRNYIQVEYIPASYLEKFESFDIKYYDTFPIFTTENLPLDGMWNQAYKRVFDVIFSSLVIIFILSWLFPIISLFIILDSGFPVIYSQKRNGLKGVYFNCLKFRSMRPDKDNDKKATVKGDLRITKVGSFLRRTSLDELPQFFNVLKGDMSVVGPRPHMISQDKYFADIINKYTLRHNVKPGITGLAQVKGYRGEVNTNHDMELRIRADLFYVKNWSFWLDIVIIVRTIFKTVSGDKNAI